MEKNTELAYRTLDYIRDHPEEWDQEVYMCGSTACFAGRAALLSLGLRDEYEFRRYQGMRCPSVKAVAASQLGWTPAEASYVFHDYTRDFEVLERRVKEVLNGEIS